MTVQELRQTLRKYDTEWTTLADEIRSHERAIEELKPKREEASRRWADCSHELFKAENPAE
jgi:chromosome segregation ATPase